MKQQDLLPLIKDKLGKIISPDDVGDCGMVRIDFLDGDCLPNDMALAFKKSTMIWIIILAYIYAYTHRSVRMCEDEQNGVQASTFPANASVP